VSQALELYNNVKRRTKDVNAVAWRFATERKPLGSNAVIRFIRKLSNLIGFSASNVHTEYVRAMGPPPDR
jgi:hypothetical protein